MVSYGYEGTQQSTKETTVSGVRPSERFFSYDLQGRMSQVQIEKFAANGTTVSSSETTEYQYGSAGNRVGSTHTRVLTVKEIHPGSLPESDLFS